MNELRSRFLDACANFQETAAQKFLVEFPNFSDAIAVCQEILQQPFTVENELCQFQAAVALRQSAVLYWSRFDATVKHQLISFIAQSIQNLTKITDYKNTLLKTLCGISAVLLKLNWEDSTIKDEFMNGVMQLITVNTDQTGQCVGLLLVQAIAEEFSLYTATPLNLSVSYHKQCSQDFQNLYLQNAFISCINLSGLFLQVSCTAICFLCPSALNSILTWDFERISQIGTIRKKSEEYELHSGLTVTYIRPPESWIEILADERTYSWIIPLLTSVSSISSAGKTEEASLIIQEVQQLLLNLCSISSRTFPQTTREKEKKEKYLCHVMKQVLLLLNEKEFSTSYSQSCVYLAIRCLDALSKNFTVAELLQSSFLHGGMSTLLKLLNDLTLSLLIRGSLSSQMTGTLEQNCCNLLLKIWARFCTPQLEKIYKNMNKASTIEEVSEHAYQIFEQLVMSSLKAAEEDSLVKEDENETSSSEDEHDLLTNYSIIGRSSGPNSLKLLSRLLKSEKDNMLQSLAETSSVCEGQLERISLLIEFSGFVVADDVCGEDPSIPTQLAELSRNTQSAMDDPVVDISLCILHTAEVILNDRVRLHLSARTIECSLYALTCWAETYLLPDHALTANLKQCFGKNQNGINILNTIVSICNTCLTSFPTEYDIQEIVCERLLKSLTKSDDSKKCLSHCNAWSDLLEAFTCMSHVFQKMKHKMLGCISSALCIASNGYEADQDRQNYLMRILDPFGREVQEVLSEKCGSTVLAGALLQILRGVARSTREIPDSQQLLYTFFEKMRQPLSQMLVKFEFDENIVCAVLKLAAEIVEANVMFLEEAKAEIMCVWSLQMIKTYCKQHAGVQDLEVSTLLQDEREHEHGRDIRAMLMLLKNLTDWELLSDVNLQKIDIAAVVLEGLSYVLSLMSERLLQFPKLSFQYFDLLSHICEVHPEKIATLSSSHLDILLSTIDFGLQLAEMRSLRIALEAIEGLSKYHWKEKYNGNNGIVYAKMQSEGGFALHYITLMLNKFVHSEEGESAVAACAMSILLLYLSERSMIETALLTTLRTSFPSHNVEYHLKQLFSFEQSDNESLSSCEEQFRKNLFTFVKNIRDMSRLH